MKIHEFGDDTATDEMDNKVNSLLDAATLRGDVRLLGELVKALERTLGAVGMDRSDAARVAGVPSLEEIVGFTAANLSDDDAIRAESERRPYQGGEGDLTRRGEADGIR